MPVGRKLRKEKTISQNGSPAPQPAGKEEFIDQARERLAALPDVRLDRIRKASLRVMQGFYDRPQVVEKIADRFLEEMGID